MPQLRPFDRSQMQPVLDLLFYARRQHNHLDWHRPAHFLDMLDTTTLTLWDGEHLLGMIALAPPLGGAQWVRLMAVDNVAEAGYVVRELMQAAAAAAHEQAAQSLYCLVVQRWLGAHLPVLGFRYVEDVVTMGRMGDELPALTNSPYRVQNGYLEHLTEMIAIDHAAFVPPWQMSRDDLRHAQRQSTSCTLAMLDGRPVAYQLTTRHQTSAHLARLAVLPAHQGRGVGALLLHDVISGMLRRSVRAMSVNTQQTNHHSQQLYRRFGFQYNGFDLPVWVRALH